MRPLSDPQDSDNLTWPPIHAASPPTLPHIPAWGTSCRFWLLVSVFAALIVLTGLTVAVAQFDLGNLNLYIAMAIATLKASLVVLFFMHLFWDRGFNTMVFIGCLLFVSLFIGITLTDQQASDALGHPRRGPGDARRAYAPGEPGEVSERRAVGRESALGGAAAGRKRWKPAAWPWWLYSWPWGCSSPPRIAVYLLMRRMHQPWPPQGFPALPPSLWLSTLDMSFGSVTIQGAVLAARRGDKSGLRRNLVASLVFGLWGSSACNPTPGTRSGCRSPACRPFQHYLQMFYALTGLHAVHVLGGLVPLVMVTVAAFQRPVWPQEERRRPLHGHLLALSRGAVVRAYLCWCICCSRLIAAVLADHRQRCHVRRDFPSYGTGATGKRQDRRTDAGREP